MIVVTYPSIKCLKCLHSVHALICAVLFLLYSIHDPDETFGVTLHGAAGTTESPTQSHSNLNVKINAYENPNIQALDILLTVT